MSQGTLFDPASGADAPGPPEVSPPPLSALSAEQAERVRVHELKPKLQALALEMLEEDRAKGGHGIAFFHVRHAAEHRGWLTGEEPDRVLSFGSQLMRGAGGVPCGWATSKHKKSNRRTVRLFRLEPVPPVEDGA